MMRNLKMLFWIAIISTAVGANSLANETWTTDVDAALAAGKKTGKDVLLLYTGSDWCPPCKKLEQEIFETDAFRKEAPNMFELVMFDFPKTKQLPQPIVDQNKKWAEKYGISAYPTLVLIDSKQRPFAITGYREMDAEEYLGMLGEFRQKRIRRDEAFDKAIVTDDEKEKAKLLDQAMGEMEEDIARLYYEEYINEIVKIDAEDELGLRTKWNAAKDSEMRKLAITEITLVSRLEKPAASIKFIDEVMEAFKFPAAEKLQIMQIKLNLLRKQNETAAMDKLLDEMIAIEELTDETRERLMVKKVLLMVGTARRDSAMIMIDRQIADGANSGYLWLAKGQLLDAEEKHKEAIESFDEAMKLQNLKPDLLIELIGAKADAQMSLNDQAAAIKTLDDFATNEEMPSDLRGEAQLQMAMIMREAGRNRRAIVAENRAVEIAESPDARAEMQKLVDRLRRRYEK